MDVGNTNTGLLPHPLPHFHRWNYPFLTPGSTLIFYLFAGYKGFLIKNAHLKAHPSVLTMHLSHASHSIPPHPPTCPSSLPAPITTAERHQQAITARWECDTFHKSLSWEIAFLYPAQDCVWRKEIKIKPHEHKEQKLCSFQTTCAPICLQTYPRILLKMQSKINVGPFFAPLYSLYIFCTSLCP